ncbi:Uncharacterised protein [Serratia grimesii]|nr:Uncharacterised protein [Serratia grimesii]
MSEDNVKNRIHTSNSQVCDYNNEYRHDRMMEIYMIIFFITKGSNSKHNETTAK